MDTCDECTGICTIECPDCPDEDSDCLTCAGLGEIDCETCEGSGYMPEGND